jgi:hypothetical protein
MPTRQTGIAVATTLFFQKGLIDDLKVLQRLLHLLLSKN